MTDTESLLEAELRDRLRTAAQSAPELRVPYEELVRRGVRRTRIRTGTVLAAAAAIALAGWGVVRALPDGLLGRDVSIGTPAPTGSAGVRLVPAAEAIEALAKAAESHPAAPAPPGKVLHMVWLDYDATSVGGPLYAKSTVVEYWVRPDGTAWQRRNTPANPNNNPPESASTVPPDPPVVMPERVPDASAMAALAKADLKTVASCEQCRYGPDPRSLTALPMTPPALRASMIRAQATSPYVKAPSKGLTGALDPLGRPVSVLLTSQGLGLGVGAQTWSLQLQFDPQTGQQTGFVLAIGREGQPRKWGGGVLLSSEYVDAPPTAQTPLATPRVPELRPPYLGEGVPTWAMDAGPTQSHQPVPPDGYPIDTKNGSGPQEITLPGAMVGPVVRFRFSCGSEGTQVWTVRSGANSVSGDCTARSTGNAYDLTLTPGPATLGIDVPAGMAWTITLSNPQDVTAIPSAHFSGASTP